MKRRSAEKFKWIVVICKLWFHNWVKHLSMRCYGSRFFRSSLSSSLSLALSLPRHLSPPCEASVCLTVHVCRRLVFCYVRAWPAWASTGCVGVRVKWCWSGAGQLCAQDTHIVHAMCARKWTQQERSQSKRWTTNWSLSTWAGLFIRS